MYAVILMVSNCTGKIQLMHQEPNVSDVTSQAVLNRQSWSSLKVTAAHFTGDYRLSSQLSSLTFMSCNSSPNCVKTYLHHLGQDPRFQYLQQVTSWHSMFSRCNQHTYLRWRLLHSKISCAVCCNSLQDTCAAAIKNSVSCVGERTQSQAYAVHPETYNNLPARPTCH